MKSQRQAVLLAMLLLIGAVSGCSNKQVVVTETTTKYAVMDDGWLADCPTVAPPDKMVYKAATLQQRVDMWAATYVAQAKVNAKCRVLSQGARDYNQLKRNESSTLTCSQGQCK